MKDQIERAIDLVIEQDQNEFLEFLKAQERIDNYTVRPDGTVDVDGDANLFKMNLTKIPVKFGVVTRDFLCDHNQLTSLIGCPEEVRGSFNCTHNQLTSLIGCPEEVRGSFNCTHNQLTSLEGSPVEVGGSFNCSYNLLTSLIGCPEEVRVGFYCNHNPINFTKKDIELAKQGKAPLGLPLSFVLMKKKEKEFYKR